MCDELVEKVDEGGRLALALVDHLEEMGASSCALPVKDRSQDYVVVVLPNQDVTDRPLVDDWERQVALKYLKERRRAVAAVRHVLTANKIQQADEMDHLIHVIDSLERSVR